MSLYEDDAVLLPPEEEPIVGKEFIRPRYQSLFDHSQLEVFSTSEETIISGDWAFERGTTSGKITPKGKGQDLTRIVDDQYLLILHKQPTGSWKIARLMWHAKHANVILNKPLK
jgi:ketosteroid isomerase-like protein